MKKFAAVMLVLALMVLSIPINPVAADSAAVQAGCSTLLSRVPLGGSEKLLDTADSVILYELNSDTLVYAYNPDGRIDPTGMVKLLTALVALEQGDLGAQVTVTRSALNSVAVGAVSAGLKAGEILTLEDLLYCVMVSSANDAAAVIAEFIGGSQEGFVQLMNEKAASLGCTGSHFTNPHGLPDEGQYSTARDLAIITEAALEDPTFSIMFSQERYTVAATNVSDARELKTTNHMMSSATLKNYVDSRVTGGKPAAASTTDRSMICTAQVGGSRYLCVVMSAEGTVSEDGYSVITFGNFEETKKLLDYGFHNFVVRQVVDDSQIFSQYGVLGGENDVVLHPSQDVFTVLPKDFMVENLFFTDDVDISRLEAPVEAGTVLGKLQIAYGTVILGSCDLVAKNDVHYSGTTIRPAAPVEDEEVQAPVIDLSFLKWVGLGLVILILLALGVLVGLRVSRTLKIRRMHRNRRRGRRRSR